MLGIPRIWGGVPQRTKNFTGREDILDGLRQRVSDQVTAVLPQALQGMGGVGKTALAIEYAHRYRSEYDLVWWISADQPALVRSSLAALAEPLGLPSATQTGIDTAAAAVLNELRQSQPSARWLLVFDNADQPEDLNEIIPRGPGDVLITSRNHRWQSVVETVEVDVFSRDESTNFLAKRVPKGIDESEAAKLAEELGDLPLALEQAGALQAETGMSVEEYRRLLREHVAELMDEGKSPEYPRSMTAAWKLSVSTLDRQMPQAVELLRCCAFFGPEPIPRDIFRRGTQPGETRAGELLANPILLARAIRELARFALVKIDGRSIQVHRLIQALLREELNPEERASYRHEVHLILAAGAPKNPDDNRLWPFYSELVAHVTSPATQLEKCQEKVGRNFALDMVRYLYRSGDRQSAQAFARRFVEQWTKDSGPDDPAVLDAQRHLGNALRDLGRYAEAFPIISETLDRARRTLGERNPLTLTLTNSFAADLRARGEFARARDLDVESLRLHTEALGDLNAHTLRVKSNLALDLGLNSDYPGARNLAEETFTAQSSESSSEVSPTDVLISWSGLARALRLCGSYSDARDVGQDAHDYGREVLGPEHYWTTRTLNDLSISLRLMASAYDEALEVAKDVFSRCTRLFGTNHPDTLAAAISLTNIQRTLGLTDEAVALAIETVDSYPMIYGPEHPYNYGCSGNLALMRRVSGNPAKARELNEEALAGLDKRLTRDHHYSLTVATNLASDFALLGETAKARELGEDTLARLRELMGNDHPLTLGCAANLAVDLRADGANETAEQLRGDILERYAATLGPEHPDAKNAEEGRRLDFDFDPPPI
jgi:tetratricopeptide (TPR) repeat protein